MSRAPPATTVVRIPEGTRRDCEVKSAIAAKRATDTLLAATSGHKPAWLLVRASAR